MKSRLKSILFYILAIITAGISVLFEGLIFFIMAALATFFIYYAGFIMGQHHSKK